MTCGPRTINSPTWPTGKPVRFGQGDASNFLPAFGHRALHGHATAQGEVESREIHVGKTGRIEQAIEQGIDSGYRSESRFFQFLDEAGHVTRIGDQPVQPTQTHEYQAVGRQRKDVVQRKGGDDHFRAFGGLMADPGSSLQHVGDHVAMSQHGALGHPGSASGVLQERDVLMIQAQTGQRLGLALR
jgi:hypothetical protein